MKITFSYGRKKVACELAAGQRLRLYSVPADYSEDGFYAATWERERLEPVPACDATRTKLLADLECGAAGDDEETLHERYLAEGVRYAQA